MFVELHHFWILFFHQAADQNSKEKKEIKNGAPQQTFDPSYFVRTLVALCSDFWEERISSIISPVLLLNWGCLGWFRVSERLLFQLMNSSTVRASLKSDKLEFVSLAFNFGQRSWPKQGKKIQDIDNKTIWRAIERSVDLERKLSSFDFSQKTNLWICFSILTTWI